MFRRVVHRTGLRVLDVACLQSQRVMTIALVAREALRALSSNDDRVMFVEQGRVYLGMGEIADMVVLLENLHEIYPIDNEGLQTEELLMGGKPYEVRRQGVVSAVVRGMEWRGRRYEAVGSRSLIRCNEE